MRRWQLVLAGRTLSVLVAGAALLCGTRAFLRQLPALRGPASTVFSPEFRAQVRAVEARLPPGAPVLHVCARQEGWFSRLWQRALYPNHRTIVVQPWDLPRLAELRAKYGARFAISVGKPPVDPGYRLDGRPRHCPRSPRRDLVRGAPAMSQAILGSLVAALLSLGFAAVGEALLARKSTDLPGWNESFLIGSGTCAALIFPLSLAIPRHALDLELVLLALAVAFVIRRRLRPGGPRREEAPRSPWSGDLRAMADDPVAVVLLAAILSVVVFFGVLNLRAGHTWDSVQVWATKAQLLFVQGGLPREWFPEEGYDSRLLAYPPYISFFEAVFSKLRGAFDYDRVKPVFLCLYASMLLGTYAAARTQCSRRWALATTLLVALLPELTTGASAGGYVDMPLAAFVAVAAAVALVPHPSRPGWRSPLPWLIGAMTTVKQEGMVLALIACGAVFFFWATERPRRLAERLRFHRGGLAVVAAFVAIRVTYVQWTGVHDITWGPFDAEHRLRALHSVGLVASTCLRMLLAPETWGFFWPAFFAAAALLLVRGRSDPARRSWPWR